MRTIGIVYHPEKRPASTDLARAIGEFLRRHHIAYWSVSAWELQGREDGLAETDLIITLGGDGTILRAARAVVEYEIPILAVNLGRLGFMAEVSPERALLELPEVLEGRGWIEQRMMLQVMVHRPANAAVPLDDHAPIHALNDVVVGRAMLSHIVEVEAVVNAQSMITYRADGLIASTPTGSTGYSLAAGGPILHPEAHNVVLTPIAPNLVMPRSLVLPEDVRIELHVRSDDGAVLSVDGQVTSNLLQGDRIDVSKSPHVTRFLRLSDPDYFVRSLGKRLHQRLPDAG